MKTLSDNQRELVRHAIGFDGRHKQSYRNHFVTGPGSVNYDDWMDMVTKGLAHRGPPSPLTGGDDLFWVTRDTALSVREKDEHLSRDFLE